MKNVTVTNNNAETWTGRFDGTAYAFPKGKAVTIPTLAAGFLFGFGRPESERDRMLVRNGWLTTSDSRDDALEVLKGFAFKAAPDDPAPPRPKPIELKATITAPGRSAPLAPASAA